MADEQPSDDHLPEHASRRERLASRRHRVRILTVCGLIAVLIAGGAAAFALHAHNADSAPNTDQASDVDANHVNKNLTLLKKAKPPRRLTHDNPLKLWIGGDSLAGSFGPALGDKVGATGVVQTTVDYKVSSGLSTHIRATMFGGRFGGMASSPSNCQCG